MARTTIVCAGCGPGAAELITPASWMAALSADILVGSRRLLDLFPGAVGEKRPMPPRAATLLSDLERDQSLGRSVTLLVEGDAAGDPTVHRVVLRFGLTRVRVLAGVSVVSAAAALLGLDARTIREVDPYDSGHDDESGQALPMPEPEASSWEGSGVVAVYAGDVESWAWATALAEVLAVTHKATVCENLSLPGERLARMEAFEMRGWIPRALTLVIFDPRAGSGTDNS